MQALTAHQSVLGYVLRERIGSGGYGEVWSAEAPGGIAKAIKFIYGVHDESRAQVELKSLDKIKEVRHPFLLSLDRIDVVEDRVVVISELADESLAEIFDRCRAEGKEGIPRQQLLDYLRDAADGLDYISDHHSLQHLDVKPENLLIVSGHVKVADFGLVKSIHNVTQSLMSGLTPTYAPPELFDGKPSKFSDQYSLAIVYQEMLTGIRPFKGTTPAQLAAQHVHGYPDLSPLNRGDQIVMQKALAKDPKARFENCRELIDELMNRKTRRNSNARPKILKQMDRDDGATMQVNPSAIDVTNQLSNSILPDRNRPIQIAGKLDLEDQTPSSRPTLVVGLGNTGTRIACEFRRLLAERIGDLDTIPSVKILAIDTDRNSLAKATGSIEGNALSPNEILEIPLRQSQGYRDKAARYSNWLSRRWIYNVPRSQQTEGLRPLGRLAFADHCEKIFSTLHRTISDLTRPECVAQTSETLQFDPSEKPRVIIVSSISGGVGSGSVLDFAYAMRTIFSDLGIRDYTVDGILSHCTSRLVGDPQLNTANTLACLTELGHFVQYGYPGDDTLGIPDFEDSIPFDNTYVSDFGNIVQKNDFAKKIRDLAEYVFLNVASPCQTFFDQSRKADKKKETFACRTMGIRSVGIDSVKPLCDELLRAVLDSWTNSNHENPQADQYASAILDQYIGYQNQVATWSRRVEEKSREVEPSLIQDAMEIARSCRKSKLWSEVTLAIHNHFESNQSIHYGEWLAPLLKHAFEEYSELVRQSCQELQEIPTIRVGGIIRALKTISKHIQESFEAMDLVSKSVDERRSELLNEIKSAVESKSSDEILGQAIGDLVNVVCSQVVNEALRSFYRKWASFISGMEDEMQQRRLTVQTWGKVSDSDHHDFGYEEDDSTFRFINGLCDDLTRSVPDLTRKFSELAHRQIFKSKGGFAKTVDQDAMSKCNVAAELEELARKIAARLVQQANVQPGFDALCDDENNERINWIAQVIAEAQPGLNTCGGEANMMIGLPCRREPELKPQAEFEQVLEREVNVVSGTYGQLTLCFEAGGIALSGIAFRMLADQPELMDLVQRIHTRSDINWINLGKLIS